MSLVLDHEQFTVVIVFLVPSKSAPPGRRTADWSTITTGSADESWRRCDGHG